ncbi:MAG: 3-oxoadipate enol-lactonase [Verrucomicrobiales bacterium]|jgi:3-oxoadipate enol-lactonase
MAIILSSAFPLNVVTSGDDRRPPLLLINPLGTTVDFWEPMLEVLESRFWIIRFDLRGHGLSIGHVEPYEISDIAADALAVLDALHVPRARVLGSSFGGLAAATLAAVAPNRVERLILAATSLRLGDDVWWAETIERVHESGMAGVVDQLDTVFFSEAWQLAVPDRREMARAMLLATPPDAYVAGAEAIRNADLTDIAPNIRASTLVIVGDEDPVFAYCPSTDLLDLIQDGEEVNVGGAFHRVLLEQPDLISNVINEFLVDPDAR